MQRDPLLRRGTPAPSSHAALPAQSKRNQHWNLATISAIAVAKVPGQIPLLEEDADENVSGARGREKQTPRCHVRCSPESQNKAEVKRVADDPIKARRLEPQPLTEMWTSAQKVR